MTGHSPLGDKIDRYARRDLSPAEARNLAQASLDSPELFDELTDSALARAALYSRPVPVRRKAWFVIAGLAAALFISVMMMRPWRTANPPLKPTLAIAGLPGQPVLLADGLQPPGGEGQPVFRGAATDSRAPQIEGSIVSMEDGLVSIDLGSLDGLDKSSEVQIIRDGQSAEVIGRLQLTTVFRDRARGRVLEAQNVRVKDRVRVDSAAHITALLEQIAALYNRGDAEGAYQAAEQANRWAADAQIPPAKQAELWNRLAVFRMLRGDYQGAEALLTRALAASSKPGLTYAQCANNLGVLAALRGDRGTSQSRYAAALQAIESIPTPPDHDRRAIEANLALLKGSR